MSHDEQISYADDLWNNFAEDPSLINICDEQIAESYAAPRTFNLCSAFVTQKLPSGRIYLYGAGTHSASLLPVLENRHDIELLGIVDMRGGPDLKLFYGYEVIAPSELKALKFDYVLLSHVDREPEMASTLLTLGVSAKHIKRLYSDPEYKDFALSHKDMWPGLPKLDTAATVIISTASTRNCLIPGSVLQDVFVKEDTFELFMGRQSEWSDEGEFVKINLYQSLLLLDEVLTSVQPKLIYFRNTVQASLPSLSIYLRTHYPDIAVVHETYDLGSFIEDYRLHDIWGFSDDTIQLARLSEIYSFRYGKALVHKNIGNLWDEFSARCEANLLTYFPGVSPVDDKKQHRGRKRTGDISIAYPAGLSPYGDIVSPDILITLEWISTIERVSHEDGVNVHLYNHYHRSLDDASLFQYYIDRFADTSVHYHSYAPHATMLNEISQFDFGWLYFEESPTLVRENLWRIGLPNKFTDYVQAGLPTIVTDMFGCVAELVEKYNAGIVIPSNNPILIHERIKSVDIEDLREGTRRLQHDMCKGNQHTLKHLSQLVASSAASVESSS